MRILIILIKLFKNYRGILNRAEEIRLAADYNCESVELSDAREMVEHAEIFVTAMRAEFMPY